MPFDATAKTKSKTHKSGGINFAPKEPLRKIKSSDKERIESSSLTRIIKNIHNEVSKQFTEMRREIAETGRIIAGVCAGKQSVQRNPLDNSFALLPALPKKPQIGLSVFPLAQLKSSELISMWNQSRPQTSPLFFGNNIKSQIQNTMAARIIAGHEELFDEVFHQQEALSMRDFGTVIIRPFYDSDGGGNPLTYTVPITESEHGTLFDGYAFCPECEWEGSPDDVEQSEAMPQCPECGSYNAQSIEKTEGEITKAVGYKEMKQGNIGVELLPVPACNWDLSQMVHDSSYFEFSSKVSAKLAKSYLEIDITEGGEDFGVSIVEEITNRGGDINGYGREQMYGSNMSGNHQTLLLEGYYKPEWYAGERLQKAEKTIGGETIPKNTPLEEVFPDGIHVAGFDSMNVIVGVFADKCRVVSSVYHIQPFSGVGQGVPGVVEASEQLNIAHSAAIENLKRIGAGGGFAYDKRALSQKEAKHLLQPSGLVGLDLQKAGISDINQAVQRVRTDGNIKQSLTMIAQLTNFMNMAFQSTDFTRGAADSSINIDTMGGQQLLVAQNQMRASAPLRMKGFSRARLHEEMLLLFREYIKVPTFLTTTDKFSLTKGRFISGADLPEQIKCRFIPDTEHPNDKYTAIDNITKMSQESVNFSGMPFTQFAMTNPRMAAWFADKYDADIPQYNYEEILIVCQSRVDDLKEITQMIEQVSQLSGFQPPEEEAGVAALAALSKPVEPDEENHTIKAQVIEEYLDDDEVGEWSQMMKIAVRALINLHYKSEQQKLLRPELLKQEAQFELAARQNQFEMGMQAEQQQTAAAMQQEQAALAAPQMQAEQQAAQEEALLSEGLSRAAGLAEKEDDHLREQEAKDLQLQRNIALENAKPAKK